MKTTNIELIAEQIGEDVADAKATGNYKLFYERMEASLADLEFEVSKFGGKLQRGETE